MALPVGQPIIDTLIGFPHEGAEQYNFIWRGTKDKGSAEMQFPAEYMFNSRPSGLDTADPIGVTLREMDRFNIERGLIGVSDEISRRALKNHPDRFIPSGTIIDPADIAATVEAIRREYETFGIRATTITPAATAPPVAIDDPQMYVVYQTLVDLGIPLFSCMGVPGPRLRYSPQDPARVDTVMYDFPELVFVFRHGCEPWEKIAWKLMLKWPNLYYSTSAFAPKYYPQEIINYANTRGADKIIYAGYFPMGLSLERIFRELPAIPFKDEVWPKFLYQNAAKVLKIDAAK
jgi:uncharacterized protein